MEPFDYPFLATPLGGEDLAFMKQELGEAEKGRPLLVSRPGLVRVAEIFLEHCSPPRPARDALALVVRFLRVVLYFNDRVDRARTAEDAAVAWQLVVHPEAAFPGGGEQSALVEAARDVGRRLKAAFQQRNVEISSFAHLFRLNLASFVWSVDPNRHNSATLDEHLELRAETISAKAYLRLWGLLGGLSGAAETGRGFQLAALEGLSAAVQALANDLRSVTRDEQQGQENAVFLAQQQHHCSRAEAELAVRGRHDELLRRLRQGLADATTIASGEGDSALANHLEFIGICTRGNNTAMDQLARLLARYE